MLQIMENINFETIEQDFGMTQEELDLLCKEDEIYTQEWKTNLTEKQIKNI